jgi:hypothetical protein
VIISRRLPFFLPEILPIVSLINRNKTNNC